MVTTASPRACPLGRAVAAAVVHEQDLVAGIAAGHRVADAPRQLLDAVLLVENGNHDRDVGRVGTRSGHG
jgi:hypothetical protein